MATKKAASKKTAKAAAPVKKAVAKAAPAKSGASKTGKATAAKPAPKAVPAPKAAAKKAAPEKAEKPAAPKSAAPAKTVKAPAKAVAAPKKAAAKTAPAKAAPAKAAPKTSAPVQKPVVAAPTTEEVKPAIKPLETTPAKKAAAAPAKKAAKEPKPVVIPKTSTNKAVKYEPEFTKSVLDTQNQEPSGGPTMRYSDAELQEFRDLINRKLDAAKKELAYLQGLITRKDGSGDLDEGRYMTMEDGTMSMEREQLSQMASRQIQFIDHLEKAIMRIENKTYGVCRVTGKLIEKARLRAVPHATLSIEAKQMMNK